MVEQCPYCELEYGDFRTGLTYRDVYEMLWSGSEDPEDWTYKRRHTILGKWHQLKQELWELHLEMCRRQAEYEASGEPDDEVPF